MAVEISEEQRKKIEKIIADLKCPVDFECYKSGFKNLCKAEIVGGSTLVECPEENRHYCGFRISVGYRNFCKCPLRIYAAKKLKV
jgi:hypothetical protein